MTASVPNTPQELIKLNQKETTTEEKVLALLFSDSPTVGYHVAVRIIEELEALHNERVNDFLHEDRPHDLHLWTRDLTTLQTILFLLKNVDM